MRFGLVSVTTRLARLDFDKFRKSHVCTRLVHRVDMYRQAVARVRPLEKFSGPRFWAHRPEPGMRAPGDLGEYHQPSNSGF